MKTLLIDSERDPELNERLFSYLPPRISELILSTSVGKIDEIRLRCGGNCSLTSNGKNISMQTSLTRSEIDSTLTKMCDGSLYAFSDTINRGYITLHGGIRVGVGGRAVVENGRVMGVYDISALCIRIPHEVTGVGSLVRDLLTASGSGVLIYSRPGIGKTTLLRSLISSLAGGRSPLRVAVVDTRGELGGRLPRGLCADILSGYPKGEGISIAAGTLNPQLIVCDEISGEPSEAEAIKSAHNCGVPLLASAHASDVSGLLMRSGIRLLHDARIFGNYVGIERGEGKDYLYTVTDRDSSDALG